MNRKKYVASVAPLMLEQLQKLHKQSPTHRVRQRAHALLLSARGYSIEQLADIFTVDRDTVSQWIDQFAARGLEGLEDSPKSGRPATLTAAEQQALLSAVEDDPRRISDALAELKKRRAHS